MAVKYIVNLSDEEREYLYQITSKGKITGRIVKRAQILLLADEGHPDETIATMLKVRESTVHRTRQKCVESGIALALKESPRCNLFAFFQPLTGLRNYFFLRRTLGPEYLDLLRFFLNHRTFMRSECPQRVGKSPTQLLTGKPHPHWLELLGFEQFRPSAIVAA